MSQVASQVARNTGALIAARGVTMLLSLATTAHLTRALGQEGFGVLGFGLALLSYFGLVARPGLDTLAIRTLARAPDRIRETASDVTSLQVALSLLAAVLYGAAVFAFPNTPRVRAALLVVGLPLLVYPFSLEWVYQGIERMGVLALRNVIAGVVQLGGALVLVRSTDDVVPAAAVQGIAAAVAAAALYVTYRSEFGPLRLRVNPNAWRALLQESLPIAASVFMVMVYYNLDKLMLGVLEGNAAVGLYDAAYRWVTFGLVPAAILYQAFFPALSTSLGDASAMATRARAYTRSNVLIGAPIAVGGALLATPLIELLAGGAFLDAAPVLVILMVNVAVVYVNMSLGQPLIAWDRQRSYMWVVGGGALANVVLNVALIPRYGSTGAAWATLAAEGVVLAGLASLHWRIVRQSHAGVVLAAAAAAAVGVGGPILGCRAAGLPWGIGAALSFPAYALTVWASRLVRASDIRALRGSPPVTS